MPPHMLQRQLYIRQGNPSHAPGTACLAATRRHHDSCVGLLRLHSYPKQSSRCAVEPDYLFPHLDMQCLSVEYLAPASYARTLLCLRWAAQSSTLSGSSALTASEASALTLRSMKSTALAAAAQLRLSRDERLAQGHRRDSARLYSRNDTFASLRIQRSITLAVTNGWRPQRFMARGCSGSVPETPRAKQAEVPTSVACLVLVKKTKKKEREKERARERESERLRSCSCSCESITYPPPYITAEPLACGLRGPCTTPRRAQRAGD